MSIQFIGSNPSVRRREEIAAEKRREQQASISQASADRAAQTFEDENAYNEMKYDIYSGGLGGVPSTQPKPEEDYSSASINNFKTTGINGAAKSPTINVSSPGDTTPNTAPKASPFGGLGINGDPAPAKPNDVDYTHASINGYDKRMKEQQKRQAGGYFYEPRASINYWYKYEKDRPPVNKRAAGRFLEELYKDDYARRQDAQRQANNERDYQMRVRAEKRERTARQLMHQDRGFELLGEYAKTRDPHTLFRAKNLLRSGGVPWQEEWKDPTDAYAFAKVNELGDRYFKDAPPSLKAQMAHAGVAAGRSGGDEMAILTAMQGAAGNYAPTRDKPFTDAQSKSAGYGNRMVQAEQLMSNMMEKGFEPGKFWETHMAEIPVVGNYTASPEYQQFRQAQEDWVRAKLRRESGAVIGDDEMSREISVYFPQPGDKPDVIAQKEQARRVATQNLIAESQGAYQQFFGQIPAPRSPQGSVPNNNTVPVSRNSGSALPPLTREELNGGANLPTPQSKEEYARLPIGTRYLAPNGQVLTKKTPTAAEQPPSEYEINLLQQRANAGDGEAQSRLNELRLNGLVPMGDAEVFGNLKRQDVTR